MQHADLIIQLFFSGNDGLKIA